MYLLGIARVGYDNADANVANRQEKVEHSKKIRHAPDKTSQADLHMRNETSLSPERGPSLLNTKNVPLKNGYFA